MSILKKYLFILGIPLDVLLLGVTNAQVGIESWPRYTLEQTAEAISFLPIHLCTQYPRVTTYIHIYFSSALNTDEYFVRNISSAFKALKKITVLK